jgi:hypothetical protein
VNGRLLGVITYSILLLTIGWTLMTMAMVKGIIVKLEPSQLGIRVLVQLVHSTLNNFNHLDFRWKYLTRFYTDFKFNRYKG